MDVAATAQPSRVGGIHLGKAIDLVIIAVAVGVALGITPGRFMPEWSVDGAHNLDRARALLAGETLVDEWYFYTPLAAAFTVPATWLPEAVALALWAFFKIAVLLVAMRLAGASRITMLVACAFVPLIGDTAIGNVNAVVAAAFLLAARGAGLPLGVVLATVPKPVLLPFLLWLLIHRRRSALTAVVTAAVLTLAGIAVLGAGRYLEYFASLGTAQTYVAEPWNQAVPWLVPVLGLLFLLTLSRERDGLIVALVLGVAASPYVGVYTGTVLLAGPFPPAVLALVSLGSLAILPMAATLAALVTIAAPLAFRPGRGPEPTALHGDPREPTVGRT